MSVESDGFHSPRSHTLVHHLSNLSTISEPPERPGRPSEIQPASVPEEPGLPFLSHPRAAQVSPPLPSLGPWLQAPDQRSAGHLGAAPAIIVTAAGPRAPCPGPAFRTPASGSLHSPGLDTLTPAGWLAHGLGPLQHGNVCGRGRPQGWRWNATAAVHSGIGRGSVHAEPVCTQGGSFAASLQAQQDELGVRSAFAGSGLSARRSDESGAGEAAQQAFEGALDGRHLPAVRVPRAGVHHHGPARRSVLPPAGPSQADRWACLVRAAADAMLPACWLVRAPPVHASNSLPGSAAAGQGSGLLASHASIIPSLKRQQQRAAGKALPPDDNPTLPRRLGQLQRDEGKAGAGRPGAHATPPAAARAGRPAHLLPALGAAPAGAPGPAPAPAWPRAPLTRTSHGCALTKHQPPPICSCPRPRPRGQVARNRLAEQLASFGGYASRH